MPIQSRASLQRRRNLLLTGNTESFHVNSKRNMRGSGNDLAARLLTLRRKEQIHAQIVLTLAAVAAVGTAAVAPAEARGLGRGAAIGAGIAAGALGAAAAGAYYNNDGYGPGYGYGPSVGYYADPGYYGDGLHVYHHYRNW
jgi:hypothetical protein